MPGNYVVFYVALLHTVPILYYPARSERSVYPLPRIHPPRSPSVVPLQNVTHVMVTHVTVYRYVIHKKKKRCILRYILLHKKKRDDPIPYHRAAHRRWVIIYPYPFRIAQCMLCFAPLLPQHPIHHLT